MGDDLPPACRCLHSILPACPGGVAAVNMNMNINKVYEHIQVFGYPDWTIQRFGVMQDGKYRWRLFYKGTPEAALKTPAAFEDAMRMAREYAARSESERND